jgi:hypothetical protein
MKVKSLGSAALALCCSVGVAAAQSPGPVQSAGPVDPSVVQKLLPGHGTMANAAANGAPLTGGGATLNAPGNTPTGWNYFHVTNCEWYYDGTNNYIIVYPQEGGYWYYANNGYPYNIWTPACQTGNWTAVYVYNSSTGAFNYIYTYDYK